MRYGIQVVILLLAGSAFGQVGNYRSLATGPWATAGTWERDADSNGSFEESPSTVAPVTITGTVTVQVGHNVTYNVSAGNVNSGGSVVNNGTITWGTIPLRILNVNSGGSFSNNGTVTSSSPSRLKFNTGSSYFHLFTDGGTIPSAAWDVNSTMVISGMGSGASVAPSGLNQVFGNFVWNTPAFDSFIDLEGMVQTIAGDFIITDTGSGAFVYNFGTGLPGNNNVTLSVGGDLINNGQFGFTSGIGATGSLTVNSSDTPGKGLKMQSGYLQIGDNDNVAMTVSGILSVTGGDFELSATSSVVTIDLSGDYTYTGGTLYTSGATSTLNFSGTSTQTVTATLAPSGTLNYVAQSNSIVTIPNNSFLSGAGGFTLTSNATLQVGSTDASGAIRLGGVGGNLRMTGTRTYTNPSTIVYSGSGPQFVGNGHPTTSGVNTTINNASGVSLIVGVPVIFTTNLTLMNGNLNIGNGALDLAGTLTPNANFITVGSTGSISISGLATIGTFPFPAGAQTFANFTLDNSNGVTFANDVVLTGTLTLTDGSISFPGTLLVLSGTFAASGSGDLSPSSTSSIFIGGTGAFGTIRINSTNNTVGTFTFNRSGSGTGSLNGQLIVNTLFLLSNGSFTNTSGLQMANGSTLRRNSNGQLLGNAPTDAGQRYHVNYTGSTLTTGLELPTVASDMLGDLTISGGPVTLDKHISVNGSVTLTSSTFDANGFDITMAGASTTWTKNSGSFVGGSGSVIIANGASVTIVSSSTPNFTNLTANSGSTLTMPAGTVNISGNLQLNAGGTFNASGGTITLNGSGAQSISGAGKSFSNITVSKSGGSVTMASSVLLTGLLDVQTATAVSSSGNLTLVSNGSGTASIGSLAGGGSVTGSVTAQRFMTGVGRHYRDISAPVANPPVSQILASGITITGSFTGTSFPCTECATNNPSMYFYDETVGGVQTLGYMPYPPNGGTSAATLLAGTGYNLLVRDVLGSPTMSLSGTINSGSIVLPVTFTASAGAAEDGWNFIGNPYPSAVDWDVVSGWTKTNYGSNAISVWDPTKGTSGGYRTWNGSSGDLTDGRIASGQGFWIHAVSGTAITIHEQAKTATATAFLRSIPTETVNNLEIALRDNNSADEDFAYLQLNSKANDHYDQFDGVKLKSPSFNITSLSTDGVPLAINQIDAIPIGVPIFLHITDIGIGTFSLGIRGQGEFGSTQAMLHDKLTGEVVNVSEGNHVFEVTESVPSQPMDRFYLVFGEDLKAPVSKNKVRVFPNPVTSIVNVIIDDPLSSKEALVMDIMGKPVGSILLKEESGLLSGSMEMSSMPTGVYLIKTLVDGKVSVHKFIKN